MPTILGILYPFNANGASWGCVDVSYDQKIRLAIVENPMYPAWNILCIHGVTLYQKLGSSCTGWLGQHRLDRLSGW